MIEDALATEIEMTENGNRRRITILEAILMQLWKKTVAGNKRAMRVMRKYEALAETMPDTYVEKPIDPETAAAEYRKLIGDI
jgi:hypothetical protein